MPKKKLHKVCLQKLLGLIIPDDRAIKGGHFFFGENWRDAIVFDTVTAKQGKK